jgi:hypothetical protein
LGHTFWENGNKNRKVDLEKFFLDFSLKSESVHVHIVDEAFHNLAAAQIISRIQGCPCEFCLDYSLELKTSDASTEASSSANTPALVTKLLQKDGFAKSKLQKLALCLEMAQKEYGLSILLAYLFQIKAGNIKCAENPDMMGDDLLHLDQAKMKD